MLVVIFDWFCTKETVSLLRFWYQTQTSVPRMIQTETSLVLCDQVQELNHSFKRENVNLSGFSKNIKYLKLYSI